MCLIKIHVFNLLNMRAVFLNSLNFSYEMGLVLVYFHYYEF